MSWREGTALERTPDLVGQKIKVWWNDDQGKSSNQALAFRGGGIWERPRAM